ncbi:MAG: hypothetical protein OXM61_13015 [Candidatus Poribacteria bacterium]|nr:hypothetical protein [Candidatus Poribacteria bacterium]
MNNVCVSDTPVAPLGLAPGGINVSYTPFASPRLWSITSEHPLNAIRAFIAFISVRKVSGIRSDFQVIKQETCS